MATVAYKRVSSTDQSTDRQLDGMTFDKEFTDKLSGKSTERPQLKAMLDYIREGDKVCVHSIDRLARNVVDLLNLVAKFKEKKVVLEFVKDRLTFSHDADNASDKVMLTMLGAFAEFERSIINERQREGIAAAKAAGKHLGRSPSLTPQQAASIASEAAQGASKTVLASKYGVSRATIYNLLKTA